MTSGTSRNHLCNQLLGRGFLLELTCGARSPEGKSHQNDDVPHQNLMTCENVTRFELFFGRDRSRTWNQMSHLDPFGPPFERNSTSIFSFELRNWIKNGPDRQTDTDGRTHMIFWSLPYTIRPSGNKCKVLCVETQRTIVLERNDHNTMRCLTHE